MHFDQQGTWARAEHHLVANTTAPEAAGKQPRTESLAGIFLPPGCQSLSFFLLFLFSPFFKSGAANGGS